MSREREVKWRLISVNALALACAIAPPAFAQSTRAALLESEKSEKAAHATPAADDRNRLVTFLRRIESPDAPGFNVTLGGFRPGAGFAPGVAWVVPVGNDARWTTRAGWSVKNFKLVETGFEAPPIFGDRMNLRMFARWEDAPALPFFGLGADTPPSERVEYALQSSEAGVSTRIRTTTWLDAGGGIEYVRTRQSSGIAWLHSSAYIGVDTRTSPGYTDRGTLCKVNVDAYADRDGDHSFTRTMLDVRQFVPIVHDNWIVAMQGRVERVAASGDDVIPFFMLPYIGGGETVRGFPEYRFTARATLLMRGELRWTPASILDMAVFIDEGTVAPDIAGLARSSLRRGWGIGGRFHGNTFTALRVEVAHGDEGWRYHIAKNVSF